MDERGAFHRDASGRLTYELQSVPSARYLEFVQRIVDRAGLAPAGVPVVGLDLLSTEFTKGEARVSIDWDNWSGLIVTALTPASEPLVRAIGAQLEKEAGEG
jgi:hypothetical protein